MVSNGTTFEASEKELLWNISNRNEQILTEAPRQETYFVEVQPTLCTSPWWCLGTRRQEFQTCFYGVLWNRRISDEILITTFCLVEQSLNAQPLVPAISNATDLDALTPYHILLGTEGSALPSHQRAEIDHRKRYVRAQAHFDAIWSRWLKKYVPSLKKRSKCSSQPERQLRTGDLVWTTEPSSPRGHYQVARVTKLNFGSGAIARSAEMKTNTGRLVRPVLKLSPLLPLPETEPLQSYHCTLATDVMKHKYSLYQFQPCTSVFISQLVNTKFCYVFLWYWKKKRFCLILKKRYRIFVGPEDVADQKECKSIVSN